MKTERYKMKNVAVGRAGIFCFHFLLPACFLLTVFGCTDTLQTAAGPDKSTLLNKLAPEATRIIREGLDSENPYIRANAVEVVAVTRQIELMPKVQRLLTDKFSPVRFAAALAVGDTEYRFAEDSIRQLLKDRDESVRLASAYSLSKLGYTDNLAILRKALASRDQTVRANAALLLGKSGDQKTLGLLYKVLNDDHSDYRVRFQAVEAIARLGDERIYRKLWVMLISAYADDRVMGISAMGALGTVQAKDTLITMLDDDVLEVRLAAAEQLGKLRDTTGQSEVLEVFTKKLTSGLDKQGRNRVNVRTALAIGQIGTTPLIRHLPQLLEDESQYVRLTTAMAVFQCRRRH